MEGGLTDNGNCSSGVDFYWGVIDVEGDSEWKRMFILNDIETVFIPTRIILLFWLLLDVVCPLRKLLV